ncbi:tRNA (adenine(22)-N(1))-methyltransferase [Vibrio metschnikovii]|uniref:tRNA (adenine(22)-N(1))-methyltransferase n=1 Tax=Vibrio metschnikovii TaxID=28172 RepID=UPI001C3016F9|nr:tRNA (adenine(22)-N(1))-methyltransferase TrmK [Vibrio metschnikovii]
MKLSQRLQHIEQLITQPYDHIWDCCCDHGWLGQALLTRQAASCIHFVDIVPELIDVLRQRLSRHYPNQTQWSADCMDVARLPLDKHHGRHLVIIAGVGGDLTAELVSKIITAHPNQSIDFILCPVYHTYRLRQQLRQLSCQLYHESLVEDNRRYYEVLYIAAPSSTDNNAPTISLVGDSLWQVKTLAEYQQAQGYLTKLLSHYQRVEKSHPEKAALIVRAYHSVSIRLAE